MSACVGEGVPSTSRQTFAEAIDIVRRTRVVENRFPLAGPRDWWVAVIKGQSEASAPRSDYAR